MFLIFQGKGVKRSNIDDLTDQPPQKMKIYGHTILNGQGKTVVSKDPIYVNEDECLNQARDANTCQDGNNRLNSKEVDSPSSFELVKFTFCCLIEEGLGKDIELNSMRNGISRSLLRETVKKIVNKANHALLKADDRVVDLIHAILANDLITDTIQNPPVIYNSIKSIYTTICKD